MEADRSVLGALQTFHINSLWTTFSHDHCDVLHFISLLLFSDLTSGDLLHVVRFYKPVKCVSAPDM